MSMKMPEVDLWGEAVPQRLTRPEVRALSDIAQKAMAIGPLLAASPEQWMRQALRLLAMFVEVRRETRDRELLRFRFEEFREWAIASGLPPPTSHKSWGGVPTLAVKRGLIEWTGGFSPARSPATKGHPVRVYRIT